MLKLFAVRRPVIHDKIPGEPVELTAVVHDERGGNQVHYGFDRRQFRAGNVSKVREQWGAHYLEKRHAPVLVCQAGYCEESFGTTD